MTDGDDADFHYALGRTLTDRAEHQDAAREFRRSIELDASRAEFHRELGVALHNLGEIDQAVASYQRARALNDLDVLTLVNVGDAAVAMRRFEDATEAYHRAAELAPTSPSVHIALVDALVGDFDAAIEVLQAFVDREPQGAWGFLNLGLALAKAGRTESSIAAFEHAVEIRPDYAVAHNQLGDALFEEAKRLGHK